MSPLTEAPVNPLISAPTVHWAGMSVRIGLAVCCLVVCPAMAAAQSYEAVGVRALGMGGAFVAVADDASAVYWNPAGLATGRFFSIVFDTVRTRSDVDPVDAGASGDTGARAGERPTGTLIAIGTPPLGLSYYRLRAVTARVGGDDAPRGQLQSLETSNVGVTVLQTLVDGVHLGGTIRYVHGSAASAALATVPDAPLDAADDLMGTGSNAVDVDLGLIATLGRVRAGLAGRNLLNPSFETGRGEALRMGRQVRAGVAVFPADGLTVSADLDLTRITDLTGARRSVAVGAEQRLWRERLGLRGGVRASVVGAARTTVTAGASLAVRTGVYADGYVAMGVGRLASSGGGAGFRVVF